MTRGDLGKKKCPNRTEWLIYILEPSGRKTGGKVMEKRGKGEVSGGRNKLGKRSFPSRMNLRLEGGGDLFVKKGNSVPGSRREEPHQRSVVCGKG